MVGFGGESVKEVSPMMWGRVEAELLCNENSMCKGSESGNHLVY